MARTYDKTVYPGTKYPTGLKISRNANVFTFEWQIGDKVYDDGQQLQYRIGSDGAWQHFGSSSAIGKTVTKRTLTFTPSNYYPTTSKKIDSISFRVRGKRKDHIDTVKGLRVQFICGWSRWSEKTFTIKPPPKPVITAEWDSSSSNVTRFSWSVTKSDTGNDIYHSVAYQKALTTNSATPSYGSKTTTTSTSGNWNETETSSVINDGNAHKRIVKMWSRNCSGDSAAVTAEHVYGAPYQAKNAKATAYPITGGYECVLEFNTEQKGVRPIDSINVQYLLAKPAAGFTCPPGATWENAVSLAYKDGKDTARFNVGDVLDDDECLWIRANTIHDTHENPGSPEMALAGKLASPTGVSVVKNSSGSQYTARVTATNASEVTDSFLAIVYKDKTNPENEIVIGVIPHGSSATTTVNCPAWEDASDVIIGVYAAVGTYQVDQTASGVNVYTIIPFENGKLISETVWEEELLAPPTITLNTTNTEGTVCVRWEWGLNDVTGAEIAWSDHDDAWESTDEPDTYEVSRLYAARWNIADLEVGRKWYVRVRYFKDTGEIVAYSPWSEIADIMLSTAPDIPSLTVSKNLILQGEDLTLSWDYTSTDGTPQQCAEICFASYSSASSHPLVYGEPFAFTGDETSITLDTSEWTVNTNYLLCVRVRSESQRESGWSSPASVFKARTITCTISSNPFSTVSGEPLPCLTNMASGFSLTVTGAEESDLTTVIVERADSYYLTRPDEDEFIGEEGETIILYRQYGSGAITIANNDTNYILGRLDDGAYYRLIAMVSDDHGQVAQATPIHFRVKWSHQAVMPDATVEIEDTVAYITPTAGQGAINTDTCDIYRLSVDKPELIVKGGTFGETYVDPYPAIGEFGGHRIVCVTANGDYIATTNQGEQVAAVDVDDGFEAKGTIIDFGGNQVQLDRNFDVSHKWDKDFEETVYLGGSVQGDWNPGVSRTASISTATITLVDAGKIQQMRRLAMYPGLCHVRTQDGSSFTADVQVSESRNHGEGGYVATYSISITRVDPQELEGVSLADWIAEG